MKKVLAKNVHKEVTAEKINEGVVKLTDHINLVGGSVMDISLYDLNTKYLLNLDLRKQINELIK